MGILILLALCCICRMKRSFANVVLASNLQRANAATTPAEVVTPTTCVQLEGYSLGLVLILGALALVLLLMLSYAVHKLRRKKKQCVADGLYIQINAPALMETIFLGEIVLPHDHLYTEGESLIREVNVNHLLLKVVAHITWGMSLKAAATRPGQDPLDLPLPETLAISSSLAKAMIGPQKGAIMARLVRYSNGLAAPVPMGLPRLVESGWSRLGGDVKDERLLEDLENQAVVMHRRARHFKGPRAPSPQRTEVVQAVVHATTVSKSEIPTAPSRQSQEDLKCEYVRLAEC